MLCVTMCSYCEIHDTDFLKTYGKQKVNQCRSQPDAAHVVTTETMQNDCRLRENEHGAYNRLIAETVDDYTSSCLKLFKDNTHYHHFCRALPLVW